MEVDVASLISWLKSEDRELQMTSLEYLCNAILFASDRRFIDRLRNSRIITTLLSLFFDDSANDVVLELNARTLFYLLESLDSSALQHFKVKHYKQLCLRLDVVDLSSASGNELAQRIIKLLDYITNIESEKAYVGGVLTSVLRFVRWNSEQVHADVVQSAMNIIHAVCGRCEPGDKNMPEWMESLTDLLNHNNYEVVVKKALHALGSIFERFSLSGRDLSSIATNDLITSLSHHLYKVCRTFRDIRSLGSSFFYYPSFLELANFFSTDQGNMSSNEDANEALASGRKPDLGLVNSLTNVLLTLCCCSPDAIQCLLRSNNYLAFSLISLLRNCQNENILGSIFRLLLVIILRFGHDTTLCALSQSQPSDDTVSMEKTKEEGAEDSTQSLMKFCSFKSAVEAIKDGDNELFSRLLSEGLDLRYVDNHDQSLVDWVAFCGTPEMAEVICSRLETTRAFSLSSALGYAAAFGRKEICGILLNHGADPNASGEDGLRPLDRVKRIKPWGSKEVVSLLEEHMSKNVGGLSDPPHDDKLQMLPIYHCTENTSREKQLFIFATEIIPELIDVFAQTPSEPVKYQAVLILLQLVSRLSSQSLEMINKYPFGVTLSFKLTQIIFMALAEESERTVLCALQLCHQLLTKARSIYLPLMHRHGIILLIKSIDSVLRLPNFRFITESDGSYYYPVKEITSEGEMEDDYHSSDSTVDFGLDGDKTDENFETDSVTTGAPSADGSEGHKENTQGQQNDEPPLEDEPQIPEPEELDSEVQSPMVDLDEWEGDNEDEPFPLSSACPEVWQQWSIVVFGNFLFIYSDNLVVLFDAHRDDNILCGLYLTSTDNVHPVEFRGKRYLHHLARGVGYQLLYLMRQLKNILNFNDSNNLLGHWPYFCTFDHPICATKRARSVSRTRVKSGREKERHRASSVPPCRNFQELGREFAEYTVIRGIQWVDSKEPKVFQAGNLLMDVVQTEGGLPFLRVRPKGTCDDVFLFSACTQQGFFKLQRCLSISTLVYDRIYGFGEYTDPAIYMDGQLWRVSISSGHLKDLLTDSHLEESTEPVEKEQLIRFKLHHFASKMLSRELASTTTVDAGESLQSAPPRPITTAVCNPNKLLFTSDAFDVLCAIVSKIASAPHRNTKEEAIDDLTECFTRLMEIFSSRGVVVTPHELASSGLISSLLLCLSPSSCIYWRDLVNSNDFQHHLEFLLHRRKAFCQVCADNYGLSALVCCLLHVLEQTERLPINIFEQISYPTSPKQFDNGISACMEALSSSISTISTPRAPHSCPPDFSNCFVFTDSSQPVEEYSEVLPLGLITPPLPTATDYHNHLTGGGVRGLLDRRLLLLLGSWFPDLHTGKCTGTVGTSQVKDPFRMVIKRRRDAPRALRVGEGKGRLFYLSHSLPGTYSFYMSASTDHLIGNAYLVKEWYNLPRKSIPFLREIRYKSGQTLDLIPDDINSENVAPNALHMGLFKWMGTCGGMVDKWINPCEYSMAIATSFQARTSNIMRHKAYYADQDEVPVSDSSKEAKPLVDEEKEEEVDDFDNTILSGEEVGARLTIDVGIQVVPTAYRLTTLRNGKNGLPVRNWCLQASNDAKYWATLSVHKGDTSLNGSPVTMPLNQENFTIFSEPLNGNAKTTSLTRRLSTSLADTFLARISLASVSTPENRTEEDGTRFSYRVFRIMNLAPADKQEELFVKGFELFGTVKFSSLSLKLLRQDQLAGMPIRHRKKKFKKRTPPSNPVIEASKTSGCSQTANRSESSQDIGRSAYSSPDGNSQGLPSNPVQSSQPSEASHPSAEQSAMEFAEVIDALIESNIREDMNEPLTSSESQPPTKKHCIGEASTSANVSDSQMEVSESPVLSAREISENLIESRGDTTDRKKLSGQELENKEAVARPPVDMVPPSSEEQDAPTRNPTSSGSLTTAELHMMEQMKALREGRRLNQLKAERMNPRFEMVAGLIPNFDPNAAQARPSSSNFYLQIPPDNHLNPKTFYREERYELRLELVARRRNGSLAASVHIDDLGAPIFKYILELAELTLYSGTDECVIKNCIPLVEISLEYAFADPSERKQFNYKPVGQSASLLTSRDGRLISSQENQLESLGIYPPRGTKRTVERTEELLNLLQLLIKLTGVTDTTDEKLDTPSTSGLARPLTMDDFISPSLTRKLNRQLQDALAVAAGPALPDWCTNLTQRVTALFPYTVRHNLFRACAFGPARSLLWMQSNVTPSQSLSEDFNDQRRLLNYLQRSEATRFAANLSSHLSSTDCVLQSTESRDQLMMDVDSFTRHRGHCECHQETIGRLFKNFIVIPRDELVDPSGLGFWAWAERVMDEHAECKPELEIRFKNEEGTGIGPTLEFFSLLSLEFRRKSSGMWLLDNDEHFVPPTISDSADYINPSFGLFPAPYPGNTVPLDVLRRFYIMGIAVGKALQDNHLLDLPLSKPFLKLLACYGSTRHSPNSAEPGSLETVLNMVADTEASRERIHLSEDPLLLGVDTGANRSGQHWLTGLLDFEDFAIIHPERAKFFRQLLHLRAIHENILKTHSSASELAVQHLLDNASVEVLGCSLQDLSINMEFVLPSMVDNETVPLLDTYVWESPDVPLHEGPVESLSSGNIPVYIRRTLEYCLDKGIRAQMNAFKVGFDRVLPLEWLSVFTSTEVGQLISGATGVSWTREELIAYTSPSLGYTKSSPTFLLLVDVLVALDTEERRKFLRFISGSSSLPAGGLKNLNPRLRIVRKDLSEGPYPSVNTCAHYLKLPEYSSAEELRYYLLLAIRQTGFHLN